MAYDEELAARIRDELAPVADVTEKKMFGGLAFLVGGAMAIAVSREGGVLVRSDPDAGPKLIAAGKATPLVMRGKEYVGWLRGGAGALRTAKQLRPWIDRGVAAARAASTEA